MRNSVLVASALGLVLLGTTIGVTADSWRDDDDGDQAVGQLPVITPADDWDSYPLAEVRGTLTLQDDCLLLGDTVVFWPLGTTWDEGAQAVVFRDQRRALVGQAFVGGGGFYSREDVVDGLGAKPTDAVTDCLERTGSDGAIFAYLGE